VPGPDHPDAREQQRMLYGEPLGDLVTRLIAGLGLTQGRLAETLGISAPMLSQLVSAQRVKIGNPAVVHRLSALMALLDEAPHLTRGELDQRLAAVRAEQATLTTSTDGEDHAQGRAFTLATLRRVSTSDELVAAADALSPSSKLGALLREAAGVSSGG
jgi:hypothetical protein